MTIYGGISFHLMSENSLDQTIRFFLLLFLAATFIQSGYDKTMYWKDNLSWLTGHFAKTPIKDLVPFSLMLILVLELASGVLCIAGVLQLLINNGRTVGCRCLDASIWIDHAFGVKKQDIRRRSDGSTWAGSLRDRRSV